MVYGSPIPNRRHTYSLKDFSYPKSSTCSANLNLGVLGKPNLENTFWPNIFVITYYPVLYTWHDHWAKFWTKEKEKQSFGIKAGESLGCSGKLRGEEEAEREGGIWCPEKKNAVPPPFIIASSGRKASRL